MTLSKGQTSSSQTFRINFQCPGIWVGRGWEWEDFGWGGEWKEARNLSL